MGVLDFSGLKSTSSLSSDALFTLVIAFLEVQNCCLIVSLFLAARRVLALRLGRLSGVVSRGLNTELEVVFVGEHFSHCCSLFGLAKCRDLLHVSLFSEVSKGRGDGSFTGEIGGVTSSSITITSQAALFTTLVFWSSAVAAFLSAFAALLSRGMSCGLLIFLANLAAKE